MVKNKARDTNGVKTFFVAPDLSMIFPTFVESAFLEGYETYFVLNDHHFDIKTKVEVLIDNFKDLILFFTVDKGDDTEFWIEYVSELQARFEGRVRIGILYKNLNSPEVGERLKHIFLYDIGISCGCIPLHFPVAKNQTLLLSVLRANQAEGRRKTIRLECSENNVFNIVLPGMQYHGYVQNISVSHFACTFTNQDPQLPIWTFFEEIELQLDGIQCKVDAVVALKRVVKESAIYVLVFRNGGDHDGLEETMKLKINKLIYDQYQNDMSTRLNTLYKRKVKAQVHPEISKLV